MNKKNADKPNQYPEYAGLHLPSMDTEILKFWDANAIFNKSIDERNSNKPFIFLKVTEH